MNRKTVLITGGSSGIGLALAIHYSKRGWNIGIIGRDASKLQHASDLCISVAKSPEQYVMTYIADVTDKSLIDKCVKLVQRTLDVPDLLVLSAGIVQSVRFDEQTDEDFENMLKSNVLGSRYIVRSLLPGMQSRGSGHICFVSSFAGLASIYGYSAYSASKFAVLGMAGALKQELEEHNIGVSVLCPPEVDTPMKEMESSHILKQTRALKNVTGTLSSHSVAKSAANGIAVNKFIIIPGIRANLLYLQARLAPTLFSWVSRCIIRLSSRKSI